MVLLLLGSSWPLAAEDIFLLSRSEKGSLGLQDTNAGSNSGSLLSADGRYLAFAADDPVFDGDFNEGNDVFLLDRVTEETILVSHVFSDPNRPATRSSSPLVMSADGSSVVSVLVSPAGARSMSCGFDVEAETGDGWDLYIDRARLRAGTPLFADGFESGDTSAWSIP